MRLSVGDWEAVVAPDLGGTILSLTHRGSDILRPTPAGAVDPLATGCFPLLPYANRIAFGTFEWEGQTHHLPRNYPGQSHPLHGIGWLVPWQVMAVQDASVSIAMHHAEGAAWPWRFRAEQHFTLDDTGLTVELAILNEDDAAMPVSLGFHPYFAKSPGDSLGFAANGMWLADAEILPSEHVPADRLGDWSNAATLVRPDLIDNCYTGWSGPAVIARDDGDIALTAEGTPALHVYVPPGEDFFCAEPVTAMPDAVNHDCAETLAPGARTRISMHIGTG